jgi:parallel beta-helix repeat protein
MDATRRKIVFGALVLIIGLAGLYVHVGIGQPASPRIANACNYIVFSSGATTYAINCQNGTLAFSGANSTTVINNVLGFGGTIVLSGGFILTGTVTITQPNTELTGVNGAVLSVGNNSQSSSRAYSSNVIIVEAASVKIHDLEIDGGYSHNPDLITSGNQQRQVGILTTTSYVKIYNNYIHDLWNTGIWVWTGDGNQVTSVEIYSNTMKNVGENIADPNAVMYSQGACGVYVYFGQGGSTHNVSVHDNNIASIGCGINFHFGSSYIASRNILSGPQSAAKTGVGGIVGDDFVNDLTVSSNQVDGFGYGILVVWHGTADAIITDNIVSKSVNVEGSGVGIVVSNANAEGPVLNSTIVSNNISFDNAQSGILIQSSQTIVRGNIVYDNMMNSGSPLGVYSGILISGIDTNVPVSGVLVQGNIAYDNQHFPSQLYGVSVTNSSGPINNVTVIDNDLGRNGWGPIGIVLVNSGLVIRSNLGYNPVGMLNNPLGVAATNINTVGIDGVASTPTSDTDYTVWGVDVIMTAGGGTNVSISIKDQLGNTIANNLPTLNAQLIPVGYVVNFGNFTDPPTVTVSGD